MPYVAIPSNIKKVKSVSLELMSPEEMLNMSYGEVLTSETINYRTGTPQMNGLFCQAIFGPVKDWECACGKYKRYRYKGIICDKCGVEVTSSSVRRERMGHITLAAPCVHPWFLRIVPSRIALLLDMKAVDVSRVAYFSAYVITEINEDLRQTYLAEIDRECENRLKAKRAEFDKKFEELAKQYQRDKASGKFDLTELKQKYEANKELLKQQETEILAKIQTIADVAKQELANLKFKDVITELQYQELSAKFGTVFKAGIGGEAIEFLLKNLDLQAEYDSLKEKVSKARGETKKKLSKRLRLIRNFLTTGTKPEWMVLRRVMVLPPDLRPMLQLEGGRFAASDLNELYRRLINRNNRLRKLIQIGAPEIILRNEKRMLQEAVEALIDNSPRGGKQVMATSGQKRPLKSLTDILRGKQGRFRQNLLGKRVDYSGRSVIIIGPNLKLDECGLPKEIALELFTPFLIGKIIEKSEKGLLNEEDQAFNVYSAKRLIESKKPIVYDILDEVIKDKYVLLNRAPTLHRLSFIAFKPVLNDYRSIQLHPLVCKAFNADFDGDQMAVHLPITLMGQQESRELMAARKNLLKPASGELIMGGHQDIVLGCYYLTSITKEPASPEQMRKFSSPEVALIAYDLGHIALGERILVKMKINEQLQNVETTVGRIIFNRAFPEDFEFINETLNNKLYAKILNKAYHQLGQEKLADILDVIKDLAFKFVTQSGITMSASDIVSPKGKEELLAEARENVLKVQQYFELGLLTDKERHIQTVNIWRETSDKIAKLVKDTTDDLGNVGMMINSGSRGSLLQLTQMAGIKGLSATATGEIIELPVQHGYIEGLTGLEYFLSMKGQRKSQADVSLKTADAGYLTRRLVDVAQNVIITCEGSVDKLTSDEIQRFTAADSQQMGLSLLDRVYGRFLAKDVVVDGQVVARKGQLIDIKLKEYLSQFDLQEIWVPSIVKARLARGLSQIAYGADFSTHQPVKLGTAVGVLAAQSLGEPSTQLTMHSKHKGGALTQSDITTGLLRVEEIYEARTPKTVAPLALITGFVEKIEGNIDLGYKITISNQNLAQTIPLPESGANLLVANGGVVSKNDIIVIKNTGEVIKAQVSGTVEDQGSQIVIKPDVPEVVELDTPVGMPALVKLGQLVNQGDPLVDGPLDLQEVLDYKGIDALQNYIIKELNAIFMANGINVNEKHIEIIIRQMCQKVQILDPGDSDYTVGELINYNLALTRNAELLSKNQKPILFKRVVTGISKAALSTDSWLAAASFQETSRVLVDAVISGRKDYLVGLKENVILGQVIPAGTGFDPQKHQVYETMDEIDIYPEEAEMLIDSSF